MCNSNTHTHILGCHGCCLQWANDVFRAVHHAAAERNSLPWHHLGNVQLPPHPKRDTHTHQHAYYPVITGDSKKQSVSEQQLDFRFLPMFYMVDLKKKKSNLNLCALKCMWNIWININIMEWNSQTHVVQLVETTGVKRKINLNAKINTTTKIKWFNVFSNTIPQSACFWKRFLVAENLGWLLVLQYCYQNNPMWLYIPAGNDWKFSDWSLQIILPRIFL